MLSPLAPTDGACVFEIHDAAGTRLADADDRAGAVQLLRAYVATAPGREDEIFLVTLGADGSPKAREDIFDL